MRRNINYLCTSICGLLCLVTSIITMDVRWTIAAAIFKVAANVLEVQDG